jgi:hypothetical protein
MYNSKIRQFQIYLYLKIPFRKKSPHSNKEEDMDTNMQYFQSNEKGSSNIGNSLKNSPPTKSKTNYQTCFLCKNLISGEIKKPEWRWNLNTNQALCTKCYERKSKEYEKVNNYCNECNKKLGFIRYNPKPLWGMNGQLCRTCWDLKNFTFKKGSRDKIN